MLDIAIVGGGLSGLALARRLKEHERSFTLFEARERLGGRILSVPCGNKGHIVDLGPSWFWPEAEPRLAALIGTLGLAYFPQYDEGATLALRDPDKKPERMQDGPLHNDARRLEGGMARLVAALRDALPTDRIALGHELLEVREECDGVTLLFLVDGATRSVSARQIVLALPPRLIEEQVRFTPALEVDICQAMRDTGTWMAHQAKVVIGYEQSSWRAEGLSGNAFVQHEQAVIGEIFDMCDCTGVHAALGGFLALTPEQRDSFAIGLPMLMDNQMEQLFGTELEQGEQHYMDWAKERLTCARLDLTQPRMPDYGDVANPLLRRAQWDGKLYFGGTETAAQGAGYLEGALDAAARIESVLAGSNGMMGMGEGITAANMTSLSLFSAWVAAQGEVAFDNYRDRLNRALAAQQRDQLTQRAILGAVEEVYDNALRLLESLTFDMTEIGIARGKSELTSYVQEPFRAFMKTLMDDVVAFNRTSCALSNFPDEHRISNVYMQTILRDIAAAWQEFSLGVNRHFLSKAAAPKRENIARETP